MSSWFRKPLNIGIAVGAGVLAVGVIVLIIYGVVTHSEPVLLQVCWFGGEARYVDGETEEAYDYGACSGDEELVWAAKQIPLTVTAIEARSEDVFAPGAEGRKGIDAAIRDINSQVGCKLLEPRGLRDGSAILARIGAAVDIDARRDRGGSGKAASSASRSPLGFARHYQGDERGSLHCDLSVSSATGNLRSEYLVAHHELLHCLGLAHDPDNPASAMYPLTADDTMWDQMQAARITDADRARLRELYCARH